MTQVSSPMKRHAVLSRIGASLSSKSERDSTCNVRLKFKWYHHFGLESRCLSWNAKKDQDTELILTCFQCRIVSKFRDPQGANEGSDDFSHIVSTSTKRS